MIDPNKSPKAVFKLLMVPWNFFNASMHQVAYLKQINATSVSAFHDGFIHRAIRVPYTFPTGYLGCLANYSRNRQLHFEGIEREDNM